jgi:FkbM family methyltransferase
MINLDLHDIRKSFYDYNRDNNQITIEFPFLNKDSIVLDLGGYKGDWASDIYSKYLCNIEVFEPIPKFYNNIKKRFINNSKIKSFNIGAYSTNTDIDMILDKDGSSIYKQSNSNIVETNCKFKSILDICSDYDTIDLIKLNVEGSEYDILPVLLNSDMINNVKSLLIQFHEISSINHLKYRNKIIKSIHNIGFKDYFIFPYVWESFIKKDIPIDKLVPNCKLKGFKIKKGKIK